MARPRRRQDSETPRSPSAEQGRLPSDATPDASGNAHGHAHGEAAIARERAADLLVQLMGAWQREHMDYEDPAHDRFLDWMAAEARAALGPAERAQLAREGEAFAKRMTALLQARDRARAGDG